MDLTLASIASQIFVPPPTLPTSDTVPLVPSNRMSMPLKSSEGLDKTPAPLPPLIVDIQEANSPPRQSIHNIKKDKIQARPVTPMDFFGAARDKQNVPLDDRIGRKSMDQRPTVDPAIKGVPQGWEDDLAVPVARASLKPAEVITKPTSNTLQKLGAFKETRTKLSSFSGTMRSGLRDRTSDREEKRPPGLKLHKGSLRTAQRSSSMIGAPLASLQSASIASPRRAHQPIHSVYSDSSYNTETSIPIIPPAPPTESTECSTADFTHLFTPTSQKEHDYPASIEHDYPASIGSSHSAHSRDRVLVMVNDPSPVPPAGMKTFTRPNIAEVLPFAAGHPFAAWSAPVAEEEQAKDGAEEVGRRGSMSLSRLDMLSRHTESSVSLEGWKETPRPRSSLPGKKVWVDAKGEKSNGVYSVGWERDVLDLEARLHETMYEVAGDRHTFVDFEEAPKAVLDIGTGAGFWPISMALQYPSTAFVGLDLVPCQIDLSTLADAEKRARTTKDGTKAEGAGMWESLERRVKWQRANFLNELPFDTGVFDLVHIRFVNLAIPETKWFDLLEEATRVLKRGGKIEIVETNYTLSSRCPASLKNSFASMLLADMIQPLPSLAMQFNLPSIESLKSSAIRPVFHQKWKRNVPGALEDAVLGWVKSAVEYKGTGVVKSQNGLEGIVGRVRDELVKQGNGKWDFGDLDNGKSVLEKEGVEEREVNVWAWVATKK